MANKCYPVVRGRRMRVTRLDGCGTPVLGPGSTIVTKGFISVALTANIDEGEEINVTNANGETCILDTPCPKFLNYGVEITFCDVNPALFAMMSGQSVVTSLPDGAGDVIGFKMNSDVNACDSGFAVELWTGVPVDACEPGATGTFGYMLLPFLRSGVLGDFTIENAAVNFVLSGAQTKKGSNWGVGPYDVVTGAGGLPGPLPDPVEAGDHLITFMTTVPPPEPDEDCEPQALGVEATGGNAGTPGSWIPVNSYGPLDLAELTASSIVASPTTAWTPGEYVVLRDGTTAHWSGTAWVAGAAA